MSPWGMIKIPTKKNTCWFRRFLLFRKHRFQSEWVHQTGRHTRTHTPSRNMHDNEQSGTGKKSCLLLIAYCHFHLPRIHPPQARAIKLEHNQPKACLFVRDVVRFFFHCSTRMRSCLHMRLILCLDSVHIFDLLLSRVLHCWLIFEANYNVHICFFVHLVASWSFFHSKIITFLTNSNEDLFIIKKNL